MLWFWTFVSYSFLGFFLEATYAAATGGNPDRKGLCVLPLCPVYGVGACLILALPAGVARNPPVLLLLGGLAATATEYLSALYHEKVLGVTFWSYQGLPGNVQGRVCLLFSCAWGALAQVLVYWVHPALLPWLMAIPAPVGWTFLGAVALDGLLSALLLRQSGDIRCLRRAP